MFPRLSLSLWMLLTACWMAWLTSVQPIDVQEPAVQRMSQLLSNAEHFGLTDDWNAIRRMDESSHVTVDRVHGGITPGRGTLPVP